MVKWILFIFLGLYIIALALLAVGFFGWFGQERDPLSAVFLLPLGMPWNIIGDRLGLAGTGLGGTGLAILAPAINVAILFWIWRR